MSSRVEKLITDVINKAIDIWQPPGFAFAVVDANDVIFSQCYGETAVPGGENINDRTLFHYCSCGKSMTSTLTAMFVDDGHIQWDDPIQEYIPNFCVADEFISRNLTFRDLLSNRCGFQIAKFVDYACLPDNEFINRVRLLGQETPFRDQFLYTNTGFTLASLALTNISGKPFESLLSERVLEPLAMRDTTSAPKASNASIAQPHMYQKHSMQKSLVPCMPHGGAAPVWITLRDAIKWLRFHLSCGKYGTSRLVSIESLQETHSPQIIIRTPRHLAPGLVNQFATYCLGWYAHEHRGYRILHHSGAFFGYEAYTIFSPEQQVGCVVLLNGSGSARDVLAWTALDYFTGHFDIDWISVMQDRERQLAADELRKLQDQIPCAPNGPTLTIDQSQLTGTYVSPLGGMATIRIRNGVLRLVLADSAIEEHGLYPLSGAIFSVPDFQLPFLRFNFSLEARLRFELDGNQVKGFTLYDLGFYARAD